jgi:hypothetical protein
MGATQNFRAPVMPVFMRLSPDFTGVSKLFYPFEFVPRLLEVGVVLFSSATWSTFLAF